MIPLIRTIISYTSPHSNTAGYLGLYFQYFYFPLYIVIIRPGQANTACSAKKAIT